MIKGIIFDVDGTTLSTLKDIQNALNIVLKNNNYKQLTYDEVRLNVGKGSKKLIQDSIPENSNDEIVDNLLQEYLKVYGSSYNIETKPYEGIQELLNELEKRNILIAFNSNKPDAFTKDLISKHYPNNKVLIVIGSREGIPNKPDPYSANEIVELMKLKKEEVLYVGDSESDIKTAKNAGLKSVGCLWGFRDFKTLENSGADYIVDKPIEILNCLL